MKYMLPMSKKSRPSLAARLLVVLTMPVLMDLSLTGTREAVEAGVVTW